MSTITVTRDKEGKLVGAGEKDTKAYSRFRQMIVDLEPGELFTLDYWLPRNPLLHGYHFVVLKAVFDHQEQFDDIKAFRMWIQTGAGHCDFLPGPTGRMVAVPKSIAVEKLDGADFEEHHEKAVDFMRGPVCTGFLWPHLSGSEQSNMIEGILTECEVRREELRAQRKAGKRK